ncbi:MAG: glycosyltransferase family 92 protein [Candidatus Electryonea clarkiae]|nr:glycosyltransferase family 92 protein [Candidatus Electryonea clarkiae]MDP8287539.1 glycosyltransferase family 92 protein [Candidatus Electryonea clarkiae]
MHYLSLCCIAQDETPYLRAWVEYHRLAGVEHFYIYDNESKVPISDTLKGYIDHGIVDVIPVKGKNQQLPAYDHCLNEFGKKQSRWIGFIDMDEFLLPLKTDDLRVLISDYEEYGGLAVNWSIFGSNSHEESPGAPQIKHYTMRTRSDYAVNHHIKSIIKPTKVVQAKNPHCFMYVPGNICVNEKYESVHYAYSPFSNEKILVNHYFNRSSEDYEEKINRGRADRDDYVYSMWRFDKVNRFSTAKDKRSWKYLELLEELLDSEDVKPQISLKSLVKLKNEDDYFDRFNVFLENGNVKGIIEVSSAAVQQFPSDPGVWLTRGIALSQQSTFTEAEHALRRSLRLAESFQAFYELSTVLIATDRLIEAKRILTHLQARISMGFMDKQFLKLTDKAIDALNKHMANRKSTLPL